MPFYTYKCVECSENKEELRAIDERDNKLICDECGSDMKREVDYPSAFQLKGPGWDDSAKNLNGSNPDSATGYEITQREMANNLEQEARIEEEAEGERQKMLQQGG